jgi:very-short-patch-repair endonuclease
MGRKKLSETYVKNLLKTHNLTLLDTYQGIRIPIKVMCSCGNVFYPLIHNIKYGKTTSCGHCNDPKIGDCFGDLTVIKVIPSIKGSCSIKCKCLCGNICGPYIASYVLTNHIVTCGNCKLKRNGRYTSKIALELHDIIESILNTQCEHNYHIKNIGYIDIAQPELKIAVEYNGFYYHKIHVGDRDQKDKIRNNKIVEAGWKLLVIKSGGRDLPNINQLITILQNLKTKYILTMPSWNDRLCEMSV